MSRERGAMGGGFTVGPLLLGGAGVLGGFFVGKAGGKYMAKWWKIVCQPWRWDQLLQPGSRRSPPSPIPRDLPRPILQDPLCPTLDGGHVPS